MKSEEVGSLPSGIIVKGIGGFYYVSTPDGVYECKARGIFRKKDFSPLPGDRVCLSIVDEQKRVGSIEEILPRESQLVRPAVANIDQVVIVCSAKSPNPDFMLLDKLLITAEHKNITSIICINKIDLDEDEKYHEIIEMYKETNYRIILTSSQTNSGFEEMKEVLKGKVTVFAGQSGVGKSTILNRIMNNTVMVTGEISSKIERGKHTTRHAELIELTKGGYIVDTPGFSSFELLGILHEELQLYYPEFSEYINKCKFTHCSHVSEPECAVKQALNAGLININRYQRYVELYNNLKQIKNFKGRNKRND